ncbi:MAG TPA: DUF3224 domain-containing protein [Candidatus Polarisedimenticolaceae bacterium]|nr:DUF3224 domain-containing protein [Candidatus Polarisedimenticolaceae bacterium]
MKHRSRTFTAISVLALAAGFGLAQGPSLKQGAGMQHASGTFDVKLTTPPGVEEGARLGRMTIDKQFHGELEGTSAGEMLTATTGINGSAAYVAFERVSASLQGRRGSFILQHSGTVTRGAQQLSVTVVPDSGTDQLAGLTGRMSIKIEGAEHSYEFAYTLPVAR